MVVVARLIANWTKTKWKTRKHCLEKKNHQLQCICIWVYNFKNINYQHLIPSMHHCTSVGCFNPAIWLSYLKCYFNIYADGLLIVWNVHNNLLLSAIEYHLQTCEFVHQIDIVRICSLQLYLVVIAAFLRVMQFQHQCM